MAQHRGAKTARRTDREPSAEPNAPSAPSEAGDERLIADAIADPRAFAPLYQRYVTPVYRYCYRRVADPDLAADLTATIFTRALEALPRFRLREAGGGTFRSWLFAIAHNVVIDSHRRQRPAGQMLEDPPDHAPGPEERAVHGDELARLIAALEQLPHQHRQIVELRLAGLTSAEIASTLSLSKAAVKSAQTRAYARLREWLSPPQTPTGDRS